jgi:hypothetical protein
LSFDVTVTRVCGGVARVSLAPASSMKQVRT